MDITDWNTNVRNAASESSHSQSSIGFATSLLGGPPLPIPFKLSIANEIQFYTSAYAITKQEWLLDHLEKIVDNSDPDLEARLPDPNINVHVFLDLKAAFAIQEAQGLVEEAKIMWPTLALNAAHVLALRKGLKGCDRPFLPYKHLRPFLALGSKRITARPRSLEHEDTLATLVNGVLSDVSITQAQDSPSTLPDLSPSLWAELFSSLVQIHDELISHNNRHIAAIKDAVGPQAVPDSLDVIAATFARRSDVDSAKMWMDQIARYMQASVCRKNENLGKQLEGIVSVLKTLELNEK